MTMASKTPICVKLEMLTQLLSADHLCSQVQKYL